MYVYIYIFRTARVPFVNTSLDFPLCSCLKFKEAGLYRCRPCWKMATIIWKCQGETCWIVVACLKGGGSNICLIYLSNQVGGVADRSSSGDFGRLRSFHFLACSATVQTQGSPQTDVTQHTELCHTSALLSWSPFPGS